MPERCQSDAGASFGLPFARLTISVFAPMALRLSRGDNAPARPWMAAWTVAAADRVQQSARAMPISRRRVTPSRRRRSLQGGPNGPRLRRRALPRGRQAKELFCHWDRQIAQLRQRLDELEEQNARLVVALRDAVDICDAAMAPGRSSISSHIAHVCHFISSRSVSLRSQLRLRWRPLLFSAALLSLTYRRRPKPSVGWPFEPVRDQS